MARGDGRATGHGPLKSTKRCQGQFERLGGRPTGRTTANRPVRASTHDRNGSVPSTFCCCRATNFPSQLVGQRVAKRCPLRRRTSRRVGTQRKVHGVWRQQRIDAARGIRAMTRPWTIARLGHHPCANRIELDAATASQTVAIRAHPTGLAALFPQRSSATVPAVEQTHAVAREGMHQPRPRARLARCQQQMHVVTHQHLGVQPASAAQPCVALALQVTLAILIVQKARQPAVPALHHVLRNAGKIDTWKSEVGPCATAWLVGRPAAISASRVEASCQEPTVCRELSLTRMALI